MRRDPLTHRFERADRDPRLRVHAGDAAPRRMALVVRTPHGPDGRPWPPWVPLGEPLPLDVAPPPAHAAEGEVIAELVEGRGRHPAISRAGGVTTFHLDPWRIADDALHERHVDGRRPLASRLPRFVFALPAAVRLRGHALLAGRGRADAHPMPFPGFPREPVIELLRLAVQRALGRADEPPPWPDARPPLVLTHDVDTAAGLRRAPALAREEERLGLRSAWYVVGDRFRLDHGVLDRLRAAGHEIGLHGARHDLRLAYLSPARIARRLDRCAALVERHEVVGFRAPALSTSPALDAQLVGRFEYDSSVPDTDVDALVGPRRGCASLFPGWRGGLLELPPTLPLDDRLRLQGHAPSAIDRVWADKLDWIRALGGMAMLVTHAEPHLTGGGPLRDAYRRLLEREAARETTILLPRQVARWWRDGERDPDGDT